MLGAIHRAGRWLFLRVEAVFNAAFGERLNPLYYLGPIAYLLFWVVVASGLYLYVFFRTGVAEAYASVEAITHGQPYVGGLMRSLHRYASDGMVLVMLLHLARHWFFDRYRGFRWFSWLSGVALLWLVYIAGINGYMLPWDRMAQFVVVATAEWLDWLPVFNGTLMRNFLWPEAVSDRLFSLLAFIHIGVPLAVLALLWAHTQRVPDARTAPPAPIAATLVGALAVLALLRPALSQGPADLARPVTSLDFDWFYLPVYALLYRWTPGEVWALVGGATLLFALAPWLPPRRRRGPQEGFHVLVRPDNRIVGVRESETLLDAGRRAGVPFPFDCRAGGCGKCKATLLYGTVDWGDYQRSALSDAERRDGRLLLCCATALSDLELAYEPERAPAVVAPRRWRARVAALAPLAPDVMRVLLEVDGGPVDYYPGQYIDIVLEDGARRSFSFATAPPAERIELHIRRIPGGRFTTYVFERMRPGDALVFEGPLGSFFLREDSDKPILFVAGATGFAPVKAMLEYAFRRGLRRPMALYWGARRPQDLYLADLVQQWAREHANFTFVPVVSEPRPEDGWSGRTGFVHEAILADHPDLSPFQVYACGSAAMVEAAYPAFRRRGLSQDDCFSDAFRLAPRVRRGDPEVARLGGSP